MSTTPLFTARLKKFISATVAVSLLVTSTLPGLASAQVCNAVDAESGKSPNCAAKRVGGVPVAYPKFMWTQLSELATAAPTATGGVKVEGGPQAVALANRTALALGLDSSVVAQTASLMPGNIPYVLGRYNPAEGTLRIDAFKLEKTTGAGAPVVRMLTTQFTPDHGDAWKANRSYISPEDFRSGNVAGVNPFAAFRGSGDGEFHSISLSGAQVAMGHAMRALGAGVGALAVTDTRLSTVTTKSGGVLKKTIRTWVYGHAKPKWLLAVPKDVLRRSTTAAEAAYCATNPALTECPLYATAASGVSFEEFSGGTLSSAENTWEIDFMKQSGLTFIGALFLAVIGSFALAGIMSAAGFGSAAGAGAGAGGAATGATLGGWGTWAAGQGIIGSGITQLGAIAFEAAVIAGKMVLIGGANLNSLINIDAGVLSGDVTVAKGLHNEVTLGKYDGRINDRVRGLISGSASDKGTMLIGVADTVYGSTCGVGSTAAACAGSGTVPRLDTYVESRAVDFVRDSDGKVLRENSPF